MSLIYLSFIVVNSDRVPPLLLPEWDIVTESEPLLDELDKVPEKSDEEKLKEYENLVEAGKAGSMHGNFCSFCLQNLSFS